MSVDRIASIEAFSIRLPRDAAEVTGTAGSPTELAAGRFDYRWSETNGTLYSVNFEAVLVKVTLESGLAGWGEAQAPLAPDVACLIIEQLLRPAVEGQDFDGSPDAVRSLRNRMYSTMRVRGQTGRLHAGMRLPESTSPCGTWPARLAGLRSRTCCHLPPPRAGFRAISRGSRVPRTRIEWRGRGRPGAQGFESSSSSTTARKTNSSISSTACAKPWGRTLPSRWTLYGGLTGPRRAASAENLTIAEPYGSSAR